VLLEQNSKTKELFEQNSKTKEYVAIVDTTIKPQNPFWPLFCVACTSFMFLHYLFICLFIYVFIRELMFDSFNSKGVNISMLETTYCNTLQHTVTHCNTLQHTATHCNTLQHTATHCDTLQRTATHSFNSKGVNIQMYNKTQRIAGTCP